MKVWSYNFQVLKIIIKIFFSFFKAIKIKIKTVTRFKILCCIGYNRMTLLYIFYINKFNQLCLVNKKMYKKLKCIS